MDFSKIQGQAVLSPMAGVTDVAFRILCKRYGAAMTYTEFVSSAAIVRGNTSSLRMIQTGEDESPVAVQLFGDNVQEVVEAARQVGDRFDVIDVNCGCPAWKVIKGGAGSALLNDPQKIGDFVKELSQACEQAVTVKIRTGIDQDSINAVEIAKVAQDSGAAALAIHGRTQKQAYKGLANWDIIKQVKEAVDIPIIGNGDVFSPEDFKEKLEYSGVDAIMVARGAIGRPFIFAQIKEYMETGSYKEYNPVDCFFEYLTLAVEYNIPFSSIKQHALSFTKGVQGGAKIRLALSQSKSKEEIKEILEPYSSGSSSLAQDASLTNK